MENNLPKNKPTGNKHAARLVIWQQNILRWTTKQWKHTSRMESGIQPPNAGEMEQGALAKCPDSDITVTNCIESGTGAVSGRTT
jgi:hypothetical protein